jgi:Cu(I)-responsive transcriptional regulator
LSGVAEAAAASGLPPKTVRYYDEIGLVRPARSANGYRAYGPPELRKLAFVARARDLGFSIEDCRALLGLYEDRGRASADVKRLAGGHLQAIDRKIDELRAMRAALAELVDRCCGDDRPDCPILRGLAGESAA